MVDEVLVDGLRYALSKGESMKQAMMSFFNAGYTKQAIEEAARALNAANVQQQVQAVIPQKVQPTQQPLVPPPAAAPPAKTAPPKKNIPPTTFKKIPPQQVAKPSPGSAVKIPQIISDYSDLEKKPVDKLIFVIKIILLVFALTALAFMITFRQEIIRFFDTLLNA